MRSIASIGSFLWKRLPLAVRSCTVAYHHLFLTSKPVFSLDVKHTGSASERLMLNYALYKWTNTIQ